MKKFSTEELAKLPPKHAARFNQELMIERQSLREMDLFLSKIANRADVLFAGAEPIAKEEVNQNG